VNFAKTEELGPYRKSGFRATNRGDGKREGCNPPANRLWTSDQAEGLSPEPKSGISIWETTSRLENRECDFVGVVEVDSNYYGFLIEHGVCSNDVWIADHDFGYQIGDAGYSDFFDFLAKVALNVWDDEERIEQEDEGEA
jgi:hypothetical protein